MISDSTTSAAESIPIRSGREAAREIFGMSLVACMTCFGLLAYSPTTSEEPFERVARLAPLLGTEALNHIGWGFGVLVPILLGFYVVAIGSELRKTVPGAAKARRTLAFLAELATSCLAPALVFIITACITRPILFGSFLIITPVAILTVFLTLQIGTFLALGDRARLAQANESIQWAENRLSELQTSGNTAPAPLVIATVSLLSGLGGAASIMVLNPTLGFANFIILTAATSSLSVGASVVIILVAEIYHTARDKATRILSICCAITLSIFTSAVTVEIFLMEGPVPFIGIGTTLTICLISAIAPAPNIGVMKPFVSLREAALSVSRRSITKTKLRDQESAREALSLLSKHNAAEVNPIQRLLNLFRS